MLYDIVISLGLIILFLLMIIFLIICTVNMYYESMENRKSYELVKKQLKDYEER